VIKKETTREDKKHFFRRFEAWILIAAVLVALTLSCSGCAQSDAPMREPSPKASSVIRTYEIESPGVDEIDLTEFRDSAGRVCVLGAWNGRLVLDCGYPRMPPLDYEQLPELGKRPL
jgi:hypothetical protein